MTRKVPFIVVALSRESGVVSAAGWGFETLA
jgi:hypothetical protein